LDKEGELADKLIEILTAPEEDYQKLSEEAVSRAEFFTLSRFGKDLRDALHSVDSIC